MRCVVVALGITVALASFSGAATGTFAGRPPMIGGNSILPQLVTFDGLGNRYVAGQFTSTADFDPGKKVRQRTPHGAEPAVFVTKFNADGGWVWTQTFGGTGVDRVHAITVAGSDVFVAGSFNSNDAGFGSTGAISAHSSLNQPAGYVFALDTATGAPRTSFNKKGAQTFGGGEDFAVAASLAVNGGTLFVGGSFNSRGFGIGGSGTLEPVDGYDGFVAALDADTGAAVQAFAVGGVQTFAGNGQDGVSDLAVSNGTIYACGTTSSTNFGVGGTGTVSTGQLQNGDAFVAALDVATGASITAFGGDGVVTFGGLTGNEQGACVAVAPGTVFLAGDMSSVDATIDGAGPPAPLLGARSLYVLAFDATTGARITMFAGGMQVFGPVEDLGGVTSLVARPGAVYLSGSLAAAGAGIGASGLAPRADAFVAALEPAIGGALSGFGTAGVVTVNRELSEGESASAQLLSMAEFSQHLALVGSVPRDATLGPVPFPSAGAYLASLDAATGVPLNMGVNRAPAFEAPLIATPNPAVRGKPVRFHSFVEDPDGDRLAVQWTFGDGDFTGLKSPMKKFDTTGTYSVRLTADDARGGQAASEVLQLVVIPRGIPYFDVTKTTIALKLLAPGGDTITVAGQIPLPNEASTNGKFFTVDVGGVVSTFTLDAFGRGFLGSSTVVVSRAKANVSKFTVKLKRGYFAEKLQDEGMTNSTVVGVYAPVVVKVAFYGATYEEIVPLFYTAKRLKSGTAK